MINFFLSKNRLFFAALIFICAGCAQAQFHKEIGNEIDVLSDPVQVSTNSKDPITKYIRNGEFKIFFVTKYALSAVVASKKFYSDGWRAEIAPLDLAVIWGKLTEPQNDKFINYSQDNRWYFWEYKAGSPYENPYIISHSSNNHIIPANDNILNVLKTVRRKDKIRLSGYLVNIKGTYAGNSVWWNSSLSRTDTADASCEVFYVEKVKIGDAVYE